MCLRLAGEDEESLKRYGGLIESRMAAAIFCSAGIARGIERRLREFSARAGMIPLSQEDDAEREARARVSWSERERGTKFAFGLLDTDSSVLRRVRDRSGRRRTTDSRAGVCRNPRARLPGRRPAVRRCHANTAREPNRARASRIDSAMPRASVRSPRAISTEIRFAIAARKPGSSASAARSSRAASSYRFRFAYAIARS